MNATSYRTLLALSLWTLSIAAVAQTPTFGLPNAPIPAIDGTGLSGFLWNSPAIEPIDDLAAARAYVAANPADATFTATLVDYPNGDAATTFTDELIGVALGVDAPSLSPPDLLTAPVLNSILQFKGFLRVDATGPLTFHLGSDDGSELVIQGSQVVNNDGLHSFPGNFAAVVDFTSPGMYEIEVLFFESQEVEWGLALHFDAPGGSAPVPTALLYPVPEPSSAALATGALALAWGRRRRL